MYNYHSHDRQGSTKVLEEVSSLEGISQLTLEKEDLEKFEFVDAAVELQKRLQELEDITVSFLTERPLPLTQLSDAFADIDEQQSQEFEFYVPEFTRNDVLCLDIVCLSDSLDSNLQSSTRSLKKISHEPLEVRIRGCDEEAQSYLPAYHNGEYEFVLTSAHGMKPGRFLAVVKNLGFSSQSVRAHLAILPYVSATTLGSGETFHRRTPSRKAEFTYFRFLLQDPSHLLTIRVNSLQGASGEESDPDIYVSNKYSGLVRVNRENYMWRSATIGSDQIDIHPELDLRVGRGQTFLIGVIGQNELFQDFSISVTSTPPPPILPLLPSQFSREYSIHTHQYTYFSIPVDSQLEGKIVLTVEPVGSQHNGIFSPGELNADLNRLTQQLGRSVYTEDSLSSAGLRLLPESEGSSQALVIHDCNYQASSQSFLHLSIPASFSKDAGIFPIGFLSDHSLYPSREFHVWRGSGLTGAFRVCIEASEWKYSHSKICYMSLIGAQLPTRNKTPETIRCKISVSLMEDPQAKDSSWKRIVEIFNSVFDHVDGCAISQQERSRKSDKAVERLDLHGLTYGEVDFSSFLSILRDSRSRDNHVFVDLGCGVGKSLVAAALSGIKFLRCIGIELLPGLCEEAKKAIENLKQCASAQHISLPLMEIWEGDFCDAKFSSWTDADVVFISSLCFPDHAVQQLMKCAKLMRPGTVVITLKAPDPSSLFEVMSTGWYKMTWGRVLVFFLRRTENSAEEVRDSL